MQPVSLMRSFPLNPPVGSTEGWVPGVGSLANSFFFPSAAVSSSRGGVVCGPEPLLTSSTLSRGGVTFSGGSSIRSSGACGLSLGGSRVVAAGGDMLSAGSRGGSVLVGDACAPSIPCPLPTEGGFSSCSGGRSSLGSSVRFVSTTTSRRTKY